MELRKIMPNPASASMLHPGRENIHPLFDPIKFSPDIDYDRAIYPAALLATRLLNTPQALQHDYCFYFGKNKRAATPKALDDNFTIDDLPCAYACDKGVGELSEADIRAVERQRLLLADRVSFQIENLEGFHGVCEWHRPPDGSGRTGHDSIVMFSRNAYNKALNSRHNPQDAARANLGLACILLHEIAHAAHHRLYGLKAEDYRETSNIAEGGFELVTRIFGLHLNIKSTDLDLDWETWQYQKSPSCDLDRLARQTWQLPMKKWMFPVKPEFIMKLSDDDFWEGEYVERGALALIPERIARWCRAESGHRGGLYKAIPLSIRDLFRIEGPNYAQKKYAKFANSERQLRSAPDSDRRV